MRPRQLRLLIIALALGLSVAAAAYAGPGAPAAGQPGVFLPLIALGGPTPVPAPDPRPAQGGLFLPRDTQSSGAALAVDAAGGLHTASAAYLPLAEHPPVIYSYCPPPASGCLSPSGWRSARLADGAEEVQIALTAAGQPRLLFRAYNLAADDRAYYYAACDAACDQAASWRIARVARTSRFGISDWDMPQRSFALDAQGRPRFIFYTGGLGDPHHAAYYAACDSACDQPGSWALTWLGSNIFDYPALALTPQGQPRVITQITGGGDFPSGVYYLACDSLCDQIDSWQAVRLLDRGYGPYAAWDIEVDGQGRPRGLIYQEGLEDGGGDTLYYIWCDAGCNSDVGWSGQALLPQHEGADADLALDGQGRPRIAYHTAGGNLGYLWCDQQCQSFSGQWQAKVVETAASLDQSHPLPVPPACDRAGWSAGLRPELSLDPRGNPRFATDADRLMRCRYQNPDDPTDIETRIHTYRHTRVVLMPQP